MTQSTENIYKLYKKHHDELLHIAKSQYGIVHELGMDEAQTTGVKQSNAEQNVGTKQGEVLQGLIDRLKSDKLRVLVIGRFSAGKSTFINALFGQAVLPASPTPTTGVLCEIRFSDDNGKKAILHPKKGMGKDGHDSPFEINISNLTDELKKYIKINFSDNGQETSRYQKLELYWSLPMLQHGVELIDSVGLDDPDSRDEITLGYAKTADAILYCMKSQDAYSAKDKQILSMFKGLGYESIFFMITYYDHIIDSVAMGETTEDQFRRGMNKNLVQWTELKEKGIQYIDSKAALLGKIQKNEDKIVSSGINEVETALETFLVEEKGRAKLLTTLRTLSSTNRAVRQIISTRRSMWQISTEDLEKRYKNAEQPLKNLETKRQLMISSFGQGVNDIAREAYDMADSFFISLPSKIIQWANEYEIKTSVFPPAQTTLKPVVEEIAEYIKLHIDKEIANWSHDELAPMIESKIGTLQRNLEESAADFIKQADEVRIHISIGEQFDNDAVAGQEKPSMFGRLIAGGYTILTGDFITGGLGAILGMKAMLRTMAYQITAGVIIGILSLFTPVGWGALAIGAISAILAGSFHNILSLKSGIKKNIGEKFSVEIGKKQKELSKNVENEVKEELNKIKIALDNGLAGEISSIRGEVETILDERKKANSNAEREIQALNRLETENNALEESIDTLFVEVGIK